MQDRPPRLALYVCRSRIHWNPIRSDVTLPRLGTIVDMSTDASNLRWVKHGLRCLDGRETTYDLWIFTARAEHLHSVTWRVNQLLAGLNSAQTGIQSLVIEEPHPYRGNLVGTLHAWQKAIQRHPGIVAEMARGLKVVMIHTAGAGSRAWPLHLTAEKDRSRLHLAGFTRGQRTGLLEAVMLQAMPLAMSASPNHLDVFWCSQVFLPQVSPTAISPPEHPLTKLVTTQSETRRTNPDVGRFFADKDGALGFIPQGDGVDVPIGAETHADLGSFRVRIDLLESLRGLASHDSRSRWDLDPHFTAPILRGIELTDPVLSSIQRDYAHEDIVGISCLGTDIPWWRLRRPIEWLRFGHSLRPSQPLQALRELLGIHHPITSSQIGKFYIEGPEVSWDEMREGIEIGGVRLSDSIVQQCSLDAGSVIHRSLAVSCSGHARVSDAVAVRTSFRSKANEGGLLWHSPWEDRLAGQSDSWCTVWAPSMDSNRSIFRDFLTAPGHDERSTSNHETDGAHPSAPPEGGLRTAGLGPLAYLRQCLVHGVIDVRIRPHWSTSVAISADQKIQVTIAASELEVADSTPDGRNIFVERETAREMLPFWGEHDRQTWELVMTPDVVPSDAIALLNAIDRWSLMEDPARQQLYALFHTLTLTTLDYRQMTSPAHVQALVRWLLEYRRATRESIAAALERVDESLVLKAGFWSETSGGQTWIPRLNLTPERGASPRLSGTEWLEQLIASPARVIGIIGPAGVGKTTAADQLAKHARQAGRHPYIIHADDYCWPGPTFRYDQHASSRTTHWYGPAILDDRSIIRELVQAKTEYDLVIVEGVTVGFTGRLRRHLDRIVALIDDDKSRLSAKTLRDQREGRRIIDVPLDFAAKNYHEVRDAVCPLLDEADLVICRSTQRIWERG